MSQLRNFFSEFTVDEQRRGIDLAARQENCDRRRAQLNNECEAAGMWLQMPGKTYARMLVDQIGEILRAKGSYRRKSRFEDCYVQLLNKHEQALARATAELEKLDRECKSLGEERDANSEVFEAVRYYKGRYEADPVVCEDMPPPDKLADNIQSFEQAVRREYYELKLLWHDGSPEFISLHNGKLSRAVAMLESDRSHTPVGSSFDMLRYARGMFAELRAKLKQDAERQQHAAGSKPAPGLSESCRRCVH